MKDIFLETTIEHNKHSWEHAILDNESVGSLY